MQIYPNTLNQNSVSIESEEYGMRAYSNSVQGRAWLEQECPAEIVAEVFAVWGDAPTIIYAPLPETPLTPTPPTVNSNTLDAMVATTEAYEDGLSQASVSLDTMEALTEVYEMLLGGASA